MSLDAPSRRDAYAAFAPFYDHFTSDYEHDRWLPRLERLAKGHGLSGRRVLDVACGTGKSLRPLLALGYDGEGCDLSIAMLNEAVKALPGVHVFRADMRRLRVPEPYAWLTCLNDAINHLLGEDDLTAALTSMAGALEPGGLLTFDVNTLRTHRLCSDSTFMGDQAEDAFWLWRGGGRASGRGEIGTVEIDFFQRRANGWSRRTTRQRERWWSDEEIETAARAAGLTIAGRYGQRPGAILEEHLDEERHSKVVYFLVRG